MSARDDIAKLEAQLLALPQKLAEVFKEHIDAVTPVDTGALLAANTVTVEGQLVVFSNDKDYWDYVNDGTPKQHAQLMRERTLMQLPEIYAEALRRTKT